MRGFEASVVMPYTDDGRSEAAWQALHAEAVDALPVNVGGSDEAYWELLWNLWHLQRTFLVVEHDVVVFPGAIDELLSCPHPWCGFETDYVIGPYAGLSCTKFDASILKRYEGAMDAVGEMSDETHPPKHWCRLDAWLQNLLLAAGETKHAHRGPLTHIRDTDGLVMPSHGCWG